MRSRGRRRAATLLAILFAWSCGTNDILYDRPPPPRDEVVESRTGFVWIRGRWDRSESLWLWRSGHYEPLRSGFEYVQGHWEPRGQHYIWIEGRWRPVHQ
jgi:hypothetical protein